MMRMEKKKRQTALAMNGKKLNDTKRKKKNQEIRDRTLIASRFLGLSLYMASIN